VQNEWVSEDLSSLESCCLRAILRNSVLEELRVRSFADNRCWSYYETTGRKRTISVESVVGLLHTEGKLRYGQRQQYGARVYLAVATLRSRLWLSLINIHDVYGSTTWNCRSTTYSCRSRLHHLAMPFGQMIFGKIIKIVARGQILRLKCTKFYFSWGSAPDPSPRCGSLQRSQTSYMDLRGLRVEWDGEGKERERREKAEENVEFHQRTFESWFNYCLCVHVPWTTERHDCVMWSWSKMPHFSYTRKLCYRKDDRYISRPWAVAEIWPFEIIQDGGGRHLEFVRIENSAIRSAVPDNPTL